MVQGVLVRPLGWTFPKVVSRLARWHVFSALFYVSCNHHLVHVCCTNVFDLDSEFSAILDFSPLPFSSLLVCSIFSHLK